MREWLRMLLRRLLLTAAGCVIVLALALGAFRLLLTQLPSYQDELKQWVAAELGLSLKFAAVDARLSLRGPELTFHDAGIAASNAEGPFLFATRAAITVDPWRFLLERELTVSALTLDGTRVTIVRGVDGTFRIQGAPVGGGFQAGLEARIPLEVEVAARDSEVLYVDEPSQDEWQFTNVSVALARTAERVNLALRARPPAALAERAVLSVEGELNAGSSRPDRWRTSSSLRAADIGALARMAPVLDLDGLEGRGDVSFRLDWEDGGPVRAMGEVALERVVVPGAADGDSYDRLATRFRWTADGPAGWRLSLSDLELGRNGRAWPGGGRVNVELGHAGGRLERVVMQSDFLRVEDLAPLASILPDSELLARWSALAPTGELRELILSLERSGGDWDYDFSGRFDELGFSAAAGLPGLEGLSGAMRADARGGLIELASRNVVFDWPRVFRDTLPADRFDGVVVWRFGRDVVRLVGDNLVLDTLGARVDSDLELTVPLDGGSPRLDFESDVGAFDMLSAKRFLPTKIMPAAVVRWLDDALDGGRVDTASLSFYGALASFPFDDGDGQLRVVAEVTDAELDFVADWPAAADLDGTIEFLNASFNARGSGRVLGNMSRNVGVGIADLRDPTLTVAATTRGDLTEVASFLKSAPLIARRLGPGYERVHALGGTGEIDFELALPLLDFEAYRLSGRLDIEDGVLAFDGFPPAASEINGRFEVRDSVVTADTIEAIFLDGPVTARVEPATASGYRATLSLDGETTVTAVMRSFDLPFGERVAGQTRWQGRFHIPAITGDELDAAVRISVASNLSGVALKFPAPFAKAPGEPSNLELEFVFPGDDGLRLSGHLGASRHFALDLGRVAGAYRLRRGALRFGGEQASLSDSAGLSVRGSLPRLDLSAWLALAGGATLPDAGPLAVDTELELAELFAFGQRLGTSRFSARRGDDAWRVEIDSEAVAGVIDIPFRLDSRPQITADMTRLYLSGGDGDGIGADIDPRRLPGLSVEADEFGLGTRFVGAARAEIRPDPLGLRLVSFDSSNEHLSIIGSGSWLWQAPEGTTRLAMSLSSTDVAATLDTLGFDPAIEGEVADVTASVHWPGPPSARWLDHVSGDVALRVETGSMLDLEPGAGRVVGLMSILALPRRLALDFRDVFNKGLVFDEIAGDFSLVDGNAYTDNLKLTGPGAEIGVVGRTGLRDQDYEQQAIVTAEPGNILPTVGGLLGGPGVGAALLIFTRIFKEPLRGIGQAAYCIKGTWEEPTVERLTPSQLQQSELCAALPPVDLTAAREGR